MLFLGLVFFQVFHSIEEILAGLPGYAARISARIHMSLSWFPGFSVDRELFSAINILIIALLFTVCIFVFLEKRWAAPFALVIAILEILNGMADISGAIVLWHYFPGCISAFGLILLGLLVIRYKESGLIHTVKHE